MCASLCSQSDTAPTSRVTRVDTIIADCARVSLTRVVASSVGVPWRPESSLVGGIASASLQGQLLGVLGEDVSSCIDGVQGLGYRRGDLGQFEVQFPESTSSQRRTKLLQASCELDDALAHCNLIPAALLDNESCIGCDGTGPVRRCCVSSASPPDRLICHRRAWGALQRPGRAGELRSWPWRTLR